LKLKQLRRLHFRNSVPNVLTEIKILFSLRKSLVTNADVLKALGDIERQIRKGEVG